MDDAAAMRLVPFAPGTFIMLDDPTTGDRRLGLVCDSGTEFVDYVDHDQPATPLAIVNVFSPEAWGDCRVLATDLLLSGEVPRYLAYADFLQALCDTPAAHDPLTFNRTAKWAYDNRNYDVAEAVKAGQAATDEARARQAAISLVASIKVRLSGFDEV